MTEWEILRAPLGDDEMFAREALQREWYCTDNYVEDRNGGEVARFEMKADARHAALWSPSRVLAEVEAKRGLIDSYARLRAAAVALLGALSEDEGYDRGFNSAATEQAVAALSRVTRS